MPAAAPAPTATGTTAAGSVRGRAPRIQRFKHAIMGAVSAGRQLVALDLPGGPAFVDALRRVWDGGDAAFPVDRRLPAPARDRLLTAIAPSALIGPDGDEHRLAGGRPVEAGDALVVATSGSTGEPKGVVLTHDAVRASALATSSRLGVGADDHWLACLPLAHVGGLSVVTRALATGTTLTVLPGFDADAVADAAAAGATLVSLVATALARIDAAGFRWIVLGGAAAPPDRPDNVVATYGMTETGSGVVYDGVPLDGVDVAIADDGEIHLRGPMLLRAYRDGTSPLDPDGWFPTGDLGGWRDDGRLRRARPPRRPDHHRWRERVAGAGGARPATTPGSGRRDGDGGPRRRMGTRGDGGGGARRRLQSADAGGLRGTVKEVLPAYCAPRRLELVAAIPRTALGKPRRQVVDVAPKP